MSLAIALVDYGMGNLRSVQKALEAAGGRARITHSPREVLRADAVVLPGVGAFGEASRRLKARGLFGALQEVVAKGRPFFGICLGLQLLFEGSEENPKARGLGIFSGRVRRFHGSVFKRLKVPHMGWNSIVRTGKVKNSVLKGVRDGDYFYFVHSFYPVPENKAIVAAQTSYGFSFCSAVETPTLFACQFHPEKSGTLGLQLLRNFIEKVKIQC